MVVQKMLIMNGIIVLVIMSIIKIDTAIGEFKLLILHNNDIHAHFEETNAELGTCDNVGKCYGGIARIRKTVDDIREKQKGKRHVLHLNAGDNFQGTIYYTLLKWKVVADLIDDLKFDVMSLGNHEFDDGPEGLAPYLKNISTISVCANIDITDVPILKCDKLQKHTILDVGGTKIGVIGYLTPETAFLANTGKVKFIDEVKSIKEEVEKLKKEGVKIFIALGHSGYIEDKRIAKHVPDIDVVVGGHTNTFMYNGKPPDLEKPVDKYPTVVVQPSSRKVPVVQAFKYSKYLGYLELDFDDNGEVTKYSGNPILLTSNYPEDQDLLKKVKKWKNRLGEKVNEVIGKSLVDMPVRDRMCKRRECLLGNVITDAFVEFNAKKYVGEGWTDAPIAINQGGGIRSSITAQAKGGNITRGDIYNVLPFDNILFKVKLKGKDLRKTLEFSVARYQDIGKKHVGEFLQVSGIRVMYDISKKPGERISYLKVRCAKCKDQEQVDVKDDKVYGMILSVYLLNGGDNYVILKEAAMERTALNATDAEALMQYIKKNSPINPKLENRITILNDRSQDEDEGRNLVHIQFEPNIMTMLFLICFIETM